MKKSPGAGINFKTKYYEKVYLMGISSCCICFQWLVAEKQESDSLPKKDEINRLELDLL